jgi:uncharacterized protein (TIGR01777 family)
MRIAISGASGYLGKKISGYLNDKHEVVQISRNDLNSTDLLVNKLKGCEGVLVLNGSPIIARWTKNNKKGILESRVNSISNIVKAIEEVKTIKVFITASAVGAYNSYDFNSEESELLSEGFVSEVIIKWEDYKALDSVRNVKLRIGVVVDSDSAFIKNVKLNLKLGIRILFGKRSEPIGVISTNNLVRIVDYCIDNENVKGIINTVEPFSMYQNAFFKKLKRLSIGAIVPRFILRGVFGEAHEVLINGQKVIPEKLLKAGFNFDSVNFQRILARKN